MTLFDAGEDCGEAANTAKLLASKAAWHVAEACFQTYGGFAFAREYDIERNERQAVASRPKWASATVPLRVT